MPPKSSKYRGVTLFRPTGKWRAQISAAGKTTSLGDHDTEEEAARAFDRALINIKGGKEAPTNFSLHEYEDEVKRLVDMTQADLVADLRARARKAGRSSSKYTGVTLIKATQRYHAQIMLRGKYLHLGFYSKEEEAARSYDKAALYFALAPPNDTTNFSAASYSSELATLRGEGLTEALRRISGSPAVRMDVQSEAELDRKENAATVNALPAHLIDSKVAALLPELKAGVFNVSNKRQGTPLAAMYFPRSKDRRTRMAPMRAAC